MKPDLFEYIPPTAETTPRFAAIRAAQSECMGALTVALYDHADLGDLSPAEKPKAWPESFAAVSEACRAFAAVCAAVAPRSADLAAAERCIRLARMLANEALGPVERPYAKHLLGLAVDELTKARMQACAAVALADAGELPAWGA
jgi:hypothetical protein